MSKNRLTGLPWELMRQCQYILNGLCKSGFSGGWLA
jgi:hypothetical protein